MDNKNSLGVFLENSFGDRYMYAVNRNSFNAIGSDTLYMSIYGDKLFAEYQLNIIAGTDSGVFLKFIVKNGVPAGSRYLFVELPEVADILKNQCLLDDLPAEICVTTLDSWREIAQSGFHFTEYVFLDSVNLQGSLASTEAHLTDYRNLSWQLNLELKTASHSINAGINCTHFIVRQMENLAENEISFAHTMVGAFTGMTAIILAGGPSLKDALPWVRENRDKVVVIAASRISRILLDEGIVPHIIATVDPQQVSFEVSREMLSFADKLEPPLLVASFHASPLLVGQWRGKKVYCGKLFPWNTAINDDPLRYFGPTVGNYAISIAMHLGCEKIVLAGVDLCFSVQGQTHAEGSNENKVGPDLGQVSPRIETYGGWHADTNQGYAEALDVLKIQATLAANIGQRLYNCSLSAAKVPLIEFALLDELTITDNAVTPASLIANLVPRPSAEARLIHYRLVKKELIRVRQKFQEILNLSHEALDCADGLFCGQSDRDFKYKIRMDKIERKLDQRYQNFSVLVKLFGIRKFLALLKTPTLPEDWTDDQIESETRNYYQAYSEGSEYLIRLIDGSLQRLDSRFEEEKKKPNFNLLFSQWEMDGQYGRLLVWQHRHACNPLIASEGIHAEAKRFAGEFLRTMTEERTSQIVLLEKGHDVKHIRSKALLLYQRKEIAELEAMAQGLACHPSPEKALPYLNFVNGLIAELQGNKDLAATFYQNLLTENNQLTEDALQQIATMALNSCDLESALLALDCLAGLSAAYLPPYADLLKAAGRFEDAFNCYNRYVGLVPDDSAAAMRLGILCTEAGLLDSARELFNRVLEHDVNNSAAKILLAELDGGAPSGQISKEKAPNQHTLGSKGRKPDTILLFKGVSQYDVTRYFLTDISTAFNTLGYNTIVIDLLEPSWQDNFLNAVSGHSIMFYFSINGVGNDFLKSLQKIGGSSIAPAFNFYVDHPCHHSARISCDLSKLLISCVDNTHIDFIDEHLRLNETISKVFIPHGCSIAPNPECKPLTERSIDILFAGSFSDPEDFRKQWAPTGLGWLLDDIAENALYESYRPIATIFRELFGLNGINIDALKYEDICPLLQLVEFYVRAKRRKDILNNFSSLNIQVYGNGWNKFASTHVHSKVSFHGPIDFIGIQNKMADSKIVLNILPCFVDGGHERIFNAMLSGAACLSDENAFLSANFKNEENILLFNLRDEGYSERIAHFLDKPELLQEISNKGKELVTKNHTWLNRAEQILQAVADYNF